MNATLNSSIVFSQDIASESDSDTNSAEGSDYYQPIPAIADEDTNSDESPSEDENYRSDPQLPNGNREENGVSSLSLNDDGEEERMREASDSAIRIAFREDENRRNAPLSPENATRIMDAMRGVSFGGAAPDWAGIVTEESWIDQLRRIRQPPSSSSSEMDS